MRQNPTGVTSFDNSALAQLPEYNQAAYALHRLVCAVNQAALGLSQDQWLASVRHMTSSLFFMDRCGVCARHPTRAASSYATPASAEINEGGWMVATYHCKVCGRRWTCGWDTEDLHAFVPRESSE